MTRTARPDAQMAFLELACALKSVTRANALMGLPRPDNSRNTFGIWRFSPLD
ncbi:hypothetical protein [Lacimonas salitolerans]|uniref:Uncharacterized protein n=1 Tax=Lacimonas salitolerans TaxID=1323750 RepID=A0ABW4ELD1_9RHOB